MQGEPGVRIYINVVHTVCVNGFGVLRQDAEPILNTVMSNIMMQYNAFIILFHFLQTL